MRNRSFPALLAPFALLLAVELAPIPGAAQEIPLKHCGKLPVIEVEVASQSMLFLVDYGGDFVLGPQIVCRKGRGAILK